MKAFLLKSISKILFLLLALSATIAHSSEIPASCSQDCITPYGSILGQSPSGVKAYSNCKSGCGVFRPQHYEETFTGIQWQCVEYARRWLLIKHGVIYADVDYAIDIWDKIKTYRRVSDGKQIPTINIENGAVHPPQVGDLFIYAKVMFDGTGHVAVVTSIDIEKQTVELSEQNYLNQRWPGDHARTVSYVLNGHHYWVLDQYLIGWKRMAISPSQE